MGEVRCVLLRFSCVNVRRCGVRWGEVRRGESSGVFCVWRVWAAFSRKYSAAAVVVPAAAVVEPAAAVVLSAAAVVVPAAAVVVPAAAVVVPAAALMNACVGGSKCGRRGKGGRWG